MKYQPGFTFYTLVLLACSAGSMLLAAPVFAVSMVVTTAQDELIGGLCGDFEYSGGAGLSLREAICKANDNGTPSDTITFAVNVITLDPQWRDLIVSSTIIINGNSGLTFIQADAAPGVAFSRVLQVRDEGNLTLNNLIIRHGRCTGSGACLNLDGSPEDAGGGILNNGILILTNSRILQNISAGGASQGGGIYNTGSLNISNSALSGNRALDNGSGGAIFSSGTLTMTNTTVTGNFVINGSAGGLFNAGTMTLLNDTLTGNYSSNGLGGGIFNNSTLNFRNTLIANSTSGGDCYNNSVIGANTNNLVEDNSCSPALSGDPNLGPFAFNGGPVPNHALLVTPTISPAINAGDNATCAATDQRGVSRPQGANCDIGAYEADDVLAEIQVTPTQLAQVLASNRVEVQQLSFKNIGGVNLEWTVFEHGDTCSQAADLPWLSVAPANGTTSPGNTDAIDVTFDSTGLAIGEYTGSLCIDSNDPFLPLVVVPVTLSVAAATLLVCNGPTIDFESGFPLAFSRTASNNVNVKWVTTADTIFCGVDNETSGSGEAACADADRNNNLQPPEVYDARMITNSFDLSTFGASSLKFAAAYKDVTGVDKFEVDVSTNAGSTWTNELSWNEQHNTPGENVSISLADYLGQPDVRVRFRYYGDGWDWWAQVDDISLSCSTEEIFIDSFEVNPF